MAALLWWITKDLRLHDAVALTKGLSLSRPSFLLPVFIMGDDMDHLSLNRIRFLLDSLVSLDEGLKSLKSRLYIARGRPEVF